MKQKRFDKKNIEKLAFLCVVMLIGMFFVLFYRRFIVYSWDIDYHRWFAELLFNVDLKTMKSIDSNIPTHAITYPLFHIVVKAVGVALGGNYHWACYLVLAVSNMASICLFKKMLVNICKPSGILEVISIDAASIFTIFFVVARSPLTEWRYYAVQCAANPVHNPTLLFVRPIGILAVMSFATVISGFTAKEKYIKPLLLFTLFSLLSVFAKPNFAIVFLPAMGIVTLWVMIKEHSIKIGFALMGAVIPSLFALLWQFSYMDNDAVNIKMQFALGGFSGLDFGHIFLVSIATFPVVLILFSGRAFIDNIYYKVSVIALVIGWFEMFFLTNGPSGDFSWGYDLAVQFATITSLAISLKYNENRIRRIAGYVVFLYQAVCGIRYISLVFANFDFLI